MITASSFGLLLVVPGILPGLKSPPASLLTPPCSQGDAWVRCGTDYPLAGLPAHCEKLWTLPVSSDVRISTQAINRRIQRFSRMNVIEAEMATLRADYERIQASTQDHRSPERLIAHYEVERALADRLRSSMKVERQSLYGQLYSELFARVSDHPQHLTNDVSNPERLGQQIKIISPYLSTSSTFVEIGCGDASLSFRVARNVAKSIGVDVTDALVPMDKPENFRFLRTGGTTLDVDSSSVDLVYSNQLMEHLHPDDAEEQLMEIHRILKRGGRYICITPNFVTGPHDISKYFDEFPTGFHMREYGYASLKTIFSNSGFRNLRGVVIVRGRPVPIPYRILQAAESGFSRLPNRLRVRAAQKQIIRTVFGINAIATA